jgi:acetyltransferase (GNAT) family protein
VNIKIRRAKPEDAQGIWAVAHSRSKKVMTEQRGVSEDDLSRDGFLLYPLEPESKNQPNYCERIELSDHFWVAAENERIIGFNMAYTFETMRKFANLTSNDLTLLDYFMNGWGCEPSCVYQAQVATLQGHANRGVMTLVFDRFIDYAAGTGAPAVICEIAQAPILNKASTAIAQKVGFRMVATRIKTDPVTGKERVSGTFMRTLPANNALAHSS